jgi:trans-aconitate methyltransferase
MVHGIDASAGFVTQARQRIAAPQARFETGDATRLPWDSDVYDVTVSGLVLNFVPDHDAMAREMVRATKPGGRVAAYVWDYAGGMQMMRHFWDAAVAVSPDDARLDQAERFPVCQPEPLQALFERAGLASIAVRAIEIPTVFRSATSTTTGRRSSERPVPPRPTSPRSRRNGASESGTVSSRDSRRRPGDRSS